MQPDSGSLLFGFGIFFLIVTFAFIGLLRWIFRINHIVDRLDKIVILLDKKPTGGTK
jgi:hypothetical protein